MHKRRNKMINIIPFKKKIKGKLYITVSVPFEVEINAKYELYEDNFNNPYYEEQYEYGIDDIIPSEIKSDISQLEQKGYKLEDITEY